MALKHFFQEGNKLAVFGSFIYLPKSASDLDFTIFTKDGKNPFPCAPEYAKEIINFFNSQFGKLDLRLDFTGKRDISDKLPYDLSDLPREDLRLDGYYLIGKFFPDDNFLQDHYRAILGKNFLTKLWKRYSRYIKDFPLQEERLSKRYKDIALLLKATEKLADLYPAIREIIERYRTQYNSLNEQHEIGRINFGEYNGDASDMVPLFISAVKSRIHSK